MRSAGPYWNDEHEICRAAAAAVTNNGRTGDPRVEGTGWVAVWNRDLATPVTGMPNSASRQACSPAP